MSILYLHSYPIFLGETTLFPVEYVFVTPENLFWITACCISIILLSKLFDLIYGG
jgi:hypothetical protein